MGDRGNIAVIQNDDNDQVWLYSHWGGTEMPELLQKGLIRGRGRWTDESYLVKIIFGAVVPADNWEQETGYGISCRMQDNEHPILIVNIPRQQVYSIDESQLKDGKVPKGMKAANAQSFEDYCLTGKVMA